jgi:polysaccharide export outer membrane protein
MNSYRKIILCTALLSVATIISCVETRKSVYFVDQPDASLETNITVPEVVINKNDLLGISVSSLNASASAMFNNPNSTNSALPPSPEYLVNKEGNIQFPMLGIIKAEGLSLEEFRSKIEKSLLDKKLLVDPIVNVRYLNFKVTVLGEVNKPTVIDVRNEKISLLEALGLAGDITIYGKKDNILVIREENRKKIIKRLNLNSSEVFASPYYYLKSNDIVYVEPNKSKVATSTRTYLLLPVLLSGLSFAAIILDRVTR